MKTIRPKILLVNPSIHDFAAYDFWMKPLGLLQIGAILRQLGYEVTLLDCLDRHHPVVRNDLRCRDMRDQTDGSGKFHRQELPKPPMLHDVPRKYCRYGMPQDTVKRMLQSIPPPDAILLTSGMTYWYPAVQEMAQLLRQQFPQTPLILGGCYATLCPKHAQEHIRPDYLIQGEAEEKVARLLAQLTGGAGADYHYDHLDQLPHPAFDLYPVLKSVAIMTSRGCPYRCGFCASRLLTAAYRRRSPQSVIEEIRHWRDQFGVNHFAFFDDALLHQNETYAKPLFRALAAEDFHSMRFYMPNGIQPKQIDAEMAYLFKQAGVAQVRLSFESVAPRRQQDMSNKVTNVELVQAIEHLQKAGFSSSEIGVYVLMGLPDQDFEEVADSVAFVHQLRVVAQLASFSPIPGTVEWRRAIDMGLWSENHDLLLGNNTVFPIWRRKYGYHACQEFATRVKQLNRSLIQETTRPSVEENTAGSDLIPIIQEATEDLSS